MHALKSASRTIGFGKLADAALELEEAARANDEAKVYEKHDGVMEMYEALLTTMSDILSKVK